MFCSADINENSNKNNICGENKTDNLNFSSVHEMNAYFDKILGLNLKKDSNKDNDLAENNIFSDATEADEYFCLDDDNYKPFSFEDSTKSSTGEDIKSNSKNCTTDVERESKLFRKPDITALILCFLLVIFSVYYIIQVYMFDEDKIIVLYTQANTTAEIETTTTEITKPLMIDLNNAGIEQLCLLNGIGNVKAQAIIDYRNKNGNFSSIEELLNVKGIGESTFEKIKEFVYVN